MWVPRGSKSAYSYFFGMDDDYEKITEAEAEEVIKKWTSDLESD